MRSVEHSTQTWASYSAEYEFLAPETWRGEIWHRRRKALVEPGTLLCAEPGEAFLTRRVAAAGTLNSLIIESATLRSYFASTTGAGAFRLRPIVRMSASLAGRLSEVFRVLQTEASPTEARSALEELLSSMAAELIDRTPTPALRDSDLRAAERVRECLNYDTSAAIDLATLAEQTGMSRFRALRVFKRWYGLPPQRYQLCLRVGLAQKSLREGAGPAEVAAEYGFVDQSHLTRHFRRLIGVTPAEYARVGAVRRARAQARAER